jgi:hypothetical protein
MELERRFSNGKVAILIIVSIWALKDDIVNLFYRLREGLDFKEIITISQTAQLPYPNLIAFLILSIFCIIIAIRFTDKNQKIAFFLWGITLIIICLINLFSISRETICILIPLVTIQIFALVNFGLSIAKYNKK